jgi:hypothetical protein
MSKKGTTSMMNGRGVLVAAVLLLMGGALACMGGPQKPSVEILSPPSGSAVAQGEEVSVEYRATDPSAVVRVELEVGGAVIDAQNSPVAEGQPVMNGILTWTAEEAGNYTLIVHAYNRERVASDPVGVSVTVGEGGAVLGSTVTISLLIHGGTQTPDSSATVPPVTATRPPTAPSPSPTRPPAAPTATPTRPAPTATQLPPPSPPSPTPTQGPVPATIELINNSGEEVYYVHFASPFHNFGDDQLGSDTVSTGNTYIFNVYAGSYRLQAVAGDGFVLDNRSGVAIQGHYEWVIRQARQPAPEPVSLTVYNYCSEAIGRLYIYQPVDPSVGPNQIADLIPIGESQVFSLHPGMWAITAQDVGGNHLDHMPPMEFLPGTNPMWNACAVG